MCNITSLWKLQYDYINEMYTLWSMLLITALLQNFVGCTVASGCSWVRCIHRQHGRNFVFVFWIYWLYPLFLSQIILYWGKARVYPIDRNFGWKNNFRIRLVMFSFDENLHCISLCLDTYRLYILPISVTRTPILRHSLTINSKMHHLFLIKISPGH